MDPQDLKILGVIVGAALARWWITQESRPRHPPPVPSAIADWGADYRSRHPHRPWYLALAVGAGAFVSRVVRYLRRR